MFILGRAHQSHPAKHVLGWAVGGGWPLSQAQHWVANKTSAQPGSPSASRQTPEGGRPLPGLTRPGPIRLARPAAATLTNTPIVFLHKKLGGTRRAHVAGIRCHILGLVVSSVVGDGLRSKYAAYAAELYVFPFVFLKGKI
jgi:hypothetical protein